MTEIPQAIPVEPTGAVPPGMLDLDETQWHRVSPRYLAVVLIGTAIRGLGIVVLSGIPWLTWGGNWWIVPGLAAAAVIGALAFTPRRVRSIGYALRADDMLFHRGVLFERLAAVPYGRMQLIDINRGPLARALDLSELKLVTAAASSNIVIPGLRSVAAEELRDTLVALAESRRSGL